MFNLRYAFLRNVVERLFGILKSRFSIFRIVPPFPYATQVELVLACATVHNFLHKECRPDEFLIVLDDEPSSPPSSSVLEEDLEQNCQSQE